MNTIEVRKTYLKQDKKAIYKDLYIDGKPFQHSLKKKYPSEFSRGRYTEEFIPRITSIANSSNHPGDLKNAKMIMPIYGCQDDCCIYLFAEIEYTMSQVKWIRIAQDSDFIGKEGIDMQPLVWLNGFINLVFDISEYERIFN